MRVRIRTGHSVDLGFWDVITLASDGSHHEPFIHPLFIHPDPTSPRAMVILIPCLPRAN